MSGKEHMIIGTTATSIMGIGFMITDTMKGITFIIPLVLGGFIGSYMPDIDSQKSKAAQSFNKILMILIVAVAFGCGMGLMMNLKDITSFFMIFIKNYEGLIFFSVATILGKLSPHRMFTHKWLGTLIFCISSLHLGSKFFGVGFSVGYILHIVCDSLTKKGKKLKFFEFKLPCKNSKNKTVISW